MRFPDSSPDMALRGWTSRYRGDPFREFALGESVKRVPPYRTHHDRQDVQQFFTETGEQLHKMGVHIKDYNRTLRHESTSPVPSPRRGVRYINTSPFATGKLPEDIHTPPMSPVPGTKRDTTDHFSSIYMKSYSRASTPTYKAAFAVPTGPKGATSRPTTSLGQGPLPSLSRPYTADMDPCATAHRRNHVVGCWGSYSTFRESAPSISTARTAQGSGFVNGTSNPGRVCQLGLAVGSKEEPANSVFSTTYKRNYLNFRPML